MCQYSLEFAPTLTDHQVGMQRHPLSPVPEDRHKCDKSSEMLRVTEPLMPARYKGRHRDFGQALVPQCPVCLNHTAAALPPN